MICGATEIVVQHFILHTLEEVAFWHQCWVQWRFWLYFSSQNIVKRTNF